MTASDTGGLTRRAWLGLAAAGTAILAGIAVLPGLKVTGPDDSALLSSLRAALGDDMALSAIGRAYRAERTDFRPRMDFETLLADLSLKREDATTLSADAIRARFAAPGLPSVPVDGFAIARPLALLAALSVP